VIHLTEGVPVDTIDRQNRHRSPLTPSPAPLTPIQTGLWLVSKANPGTQAYNSSSAYRLLGPLDRKAIEASVRQIAYRHSVLRSRFLIKDGQPVQETTPGQEPPFEFIDAAPGLDGAEQEARRLALEFTRQPIDLETGPPFAARLIRLSDHDHVLAFRLHHIVFDAWSGQVLLTELRSNYEGFSTGRSPVLPPLPMQFSEYAVRHNIRVAERLEEGLKYWKDQLSDCADAPVFRYDLPRPEKLTYRAVRSKHVLGEDIARHVRNLAREERATPFMVLLAAFQALLGRASGQDDVVVGTPTAGRDMPDTENLVGCFINNLVIRGRLNDKTTFRELVRAARMTVLGALSHQHVPYMRLVQELKPSRSGGQANLFNVLFQLNNVPVAETGETAGVHISRFELGAGAAEADVALTCSMTGRGLEASCAVSLDHYEDGTARLVLDQYAAFLEQAVASPDASVFSHSLVTPVTVGLLPDPKEALAEPPFDPPVLSVLERCKRSARNTAVRWQRKSWNYSEFGRDVERVATGLVALGVSKGDRLAVTGARSYGLTVAALGVMHAGGVLVFIDPQQPDKRIQLLLEAAQVTRAIRVTSGKQPQPIPALASLQTVDIDGSHAKYITEPPPGRTGRPLPDLSGDDHAYVFFTSGTTGTPKAVLANHKGLAHYIAWQSKETGVTSRDRVSMLHGIAFEPVLRDIFLPLVNGAALCIPPVEAYGTAVLKWLKSERVTVVQTVPSLSDSWLQGTDPDLKANSLRAIFSTGEPLRDTLVTRWRARSKPGVRIINIYGPTETVLEKTYYEVPAQPEPGGQPIGRPLPQSQALVLNRASTLCGVNEPGEIVLRTPFSSLGYLNAPDAQAHAFVRNPFRDGAGDIVYRTGDMGLHRKDGLLTLLGRVDDQVKVRGVRVEPGEVNSVLARHPAVGQSAIVPVKGPDGAMTLAAYVVRRTAVEAGGLREFLAARLPQALVPSAFVFMDSLPLNASGKVDKRALPGLDDAQQSVRSYEAPQTETERRLALIWAGALGVELVGRSDNFFDLGGHSLLAAQVFDRIYKEFGQHLPLSVLFEAPTLAEVASRLGPANGERRPLVAARVEESFSIGPHTDTGAGSLVPIRSAGRRTPIFCFHSLGGSILGYRALAKYLPDQYPVWALQPRGMDGGAAPIKNVTAMARYYCEQVCRVQPDGPLTLTGISLGGVIAFEVAREAQRRGREVGKLILIDPSTPTPRHLSPLAAIWDTAKLQKQKVVYLTLGMLGRRLSPAMARGRVYQTNIRAGRNYRNSSPESITVPAVFIRAKYNGKYSVPDEAVRKWESLTGGLEEVVDVEGAHSGEDYVLAEPFVGPVAREFLRLVES